MKFCSKCGKELVDEAVICPGCGEKCIKQDASNPVIVQQDNTIYGADNGAKDKIDIKKTLMSNILPVVFLAVGALMVIVGVDLGVPSSFLYSSDVTEYVGGDAYNYIIEASLRGGSIAAAEICRCIYLCGGILISCVSALKIKIVKVK